MDFVHALEEISAEAGPAQPGRSIGAVTIRGNGNAVKSARFNLAGFTLSKSQLHALVSFRVTVLNEVSENFYSFQTNAVSLVEQSLNVYTAEWAETLIA